ncbi:4'-phosphopantetheinyl transferase Sfp [bioreactor metagenome]|uniref:4'-phosphopantetheinyl transferase Sfp n=1 Tax=bioreactor metagenome TaxID=1076179 RepID=A0A645CSA6_9ZZZZ
MAYMVSLLDDGKKAKIHKKNLNNKNVIQTLYANKIAKEKIADKLCIRAENVRFSFGKHSKPYLEDEKLWFNISHSGKMVAVVISEEPVGVDVERNFAFNPRLAKKICNNSEMRFLEKSSDKDSLLTKLWTIKESFLKASGEGITVNISDVICDTDQNCVTYCERTAPFFTKNINGYTVSVCVL